MIIAGGHCDQELLLRLIRIGMRTRRIFVASMDKLEADHETRARISA